MPEKMNRRMTPRSASRSVSRSPARKNGRRKSPSYSRSRSRSRTPPPPKRKGGVSRSRDSRSRSRSHSPRDRRRSRSRSSRTHDSKRWQPGTREKPNQSRCLGVFGLSIYTDEYKIRDLFSKYGRIERIQVVIDAKTGRSRGFCFVYYEEMTDAKVAKDDTNGMELDGRRIRVDYSITQRPHTPTPGVYMGRSTNSKERFHDSKRPYKEREYHDRYRDDYRSGRRRSGSPYRDRRRRYSRSRSYSPAPRHSRY